MLTNNPSNVAKQLSALSREEDAFRQAAAQADRDRLQVEARLRELRTHQKELSQQTRAASDALGAYQKERGLLLQQKERLQQQLQLERGELEQCAEETQQLVAHDTVAKKKFCKEMEELNDELSDLLLQQEELRLQKMIGTPETVAGLRVLLLEEQQPTPTEDEAAAMTDALEALTTANAKFEESLASSKELAVAIETMRGRALAEAHRKGQQLTEESFLQMEQGWAEQNDDADDDDKNSEPQQAQQDVPLHLQIFYSGQQEEEEPSESQDTAMTE